MNTASRIVREAHQMSRLEILEAFHAERSRCIDAFTAIEECVIQLLRVAGMASGAEPFSQKLDALRKAKATPHFSQARLDKLQGLLPTCAELNHLRNDLVHSRLQLAELSGEFRACFTNAKECLAGSQTARLFTLEQLRQVSASFGRMAIELKQVLINPASLPLRPSPGVAGGP